MDTERSNLDSTEDDDPQGESGLDALTDDQVERLGKLQEQFAERTRNANSDKQREEVQLDIERQLSEKGDRLAAVWAHAAAHGYTRPDAKFRVMVDWIDKWVTEGHQRKTLPGGFSNLDQIGKGGFGVVFRADQQLGEKSRPVAIKLPLVKGVEKIQRFWDTIPVGDYRELATLRSFADEVQKVVRVPPRHCVQVFGAFLPSGSDIDSILLHLREKPICFWMQYVPGQSLRQRMGSRGEYRPGITIPNDRILHWMTQIAEALLGLHEVGIIHKDLKPDNVLLDDKDEPWLTDFGLAAHRFAQPIIGNPPSGTSAYMAPEQLETTDANSQTDIYAWGVMFYELLTGYTPFFCSDEDLKCCILRGQYDSPKVRNTATPNYWCQIIKKCLEVDRGKRYGSFVDVLQALDLSWSPRRRSTGVSETVKPTPLSRHLECAVKLGVGFAEFARAYVNVTQVSDATWHDIWLLVASPCVELGISVECPSRESASAELLQALMGIKATIVNRLSLKNTRLVWVFELSYRLRVLLIQIHAVKEYGFVPEGGMVAPLEQDAADELTELAQRSDVYRGSIKSLIYAIATATLSADEARVHLYSMQESIFQFIINSLKEQCSGDDDSQTESLGADAQAELLQFKKRFEESDLDRRFP